MTTIQYLNQIDRWNKDVNNMLSEIWQLRQLSTSIGVVTKEVNVQTFGDKDQLGQAMSRIYDKENELAEYVKNMLDQKDIILKQIFGIDNQNFKNVLFARYVEMRTYDEIAETNNYSVRQIYRIHDNALSEFYRLYHETYEDL